MSQAESNPDSEDVTTSEADSGIVITNGPDGLGDDAEELDDNLDDTEEQPTSEAAVSEEASAEAAVEEPAESTPDVDSDTDASNENDSEQPVDEDAEGDGDSTANQPAPEVDPATDSEVTDTDDQPETTGGVTETDTEEESEPEAEAKPAEAVAEPEVEETAAENDADENEPNMSETEAETDNTTQSATTETGGDDLSEISGAPSEFNATIEADTLQDLIDSVDVLVDECKIRVGNDHVSVRAVDPANVGMVDVDLEKAAFESYNTEPGVLGLNLNKFADVVGLGNKGDLVHLDYNPQTRKLHISVGGIDYTLALIDPDSIRQEPDIPDLDLPVEVSVESSMINRGIKAADMVSDHIALGTQQDGRFNQFKIEAEGDTDDVELIKGEDDDEVIEGTFHSDADSLFSLDYLKDMNKALPNKGVVTLELGEEFPAKIHFDGDDDLMHTTFMLAPRIQSD